MLATAVGGHLELVADGVTGWLVAAGRRRAGRRARRAAAAPRTRCARWRAGGAPSRRCAMLSEEDGILAAYAELAAHAGARARARPAPAPARLGGDPVQGPARVRRRRARVDRRADVPEPRARRRRRRRAGPGDRVLDTLASRHRLRVLHQANRGLGGARNAGIAVERGAVRVPPRRRQHRRADRSSSAASRCSRTTRRSRT